MTLELKGLVAIPISQLTLPYSQSSLVVRYTVHALDSFSVVRHHPGRTNGAGSFFAATLPRTARNQPTRDRMNRR